MLPAGAYGKVAVAFHAKFKLLIYDGKHVVTEATNRTYQKMWKS
jgi:hypothetical protein